MSLLKTNEIQNYNGSSLTLTASTVSTSAQLNTGGNISVTGSLNVSDDSTTRTNLGLGTIATQDSDSITVTGGSVTGTEIDLKSSGATIFKSDGTTAVLSESGSTVTITADEANVGSNALVVDSSGNVGVGTSSPTSFGASYKTLHFKNTSGDAIFLTESDGGIINEIQATDGGGFSTFGTRSNHPIILKTNDTERMRIDSSGSVLVGYTSSNGSYKLQVNSQIYATSSTIATSDFNYKENITPLDGALSLVSQLNPVQFDWKEHPVHEFDRNQPTVGFIAQEVQQVLLDQPYVSSIVKSNECIIEPEEIDEEGNVIKEAVIEEFLGIAEGNMIALLTKAIQEQQTIIESQQSQIDAITARIEALETS